MLRGWPETETEKVNIMLDTNTQEYEAAEVWFNSKTKAEVIDFCTSHGVNLDDMHNPQNLMKDWEEMAMECFVVYGYLND